MSNVAESGFIPLLTPHPSRVVDAMRAILPPHCVLSRTEDTKPYECDGLSLYRTVPMVVVLPETESQVQAVLKLCKNLNVPVVARGAGTGLSGGSMPHAQGVLLGLAKFNRIKSIDPETARLRTPGCLGGSEPLCPLLCSGSLQPDRLHDWRQRSGKLWRRALSEVWIDCSQRAEGANGHHGW